jgi:ATP-dependent protease HslVU (ClpYQ) peptidase subunit
MTTVLADTKLGVVVSDTNFGDGDTRGQMRKVWRLNGSIIGLAGNLEEFAPFLLWLKEGMQPPGPKLKSLSALMLSSSGLLWFADSTAPIVIQRRYHAIGSGAMAAMAAHEAMDYENPTRAVRIACNHDASSRAPVRVYRL